VYFCLSWFVAYLCFSGFRCLPLLQWVSLPTFASVGLLPTFASEGLLPTFASVGLCPPFLQLLCCTAASVGFVAYLCFCWFRTHLCWHLWLLNSTSIGLVSSSAVLWLAKCCPPPPPAVVVLVSMSAILTIHLSFFWVSPWLWQLMSLSPKVHSQSASDFFKQICLP
jgi:hypothetical protein